MKSSPQIKIIFNGTIWLLLMSILLTGCEASVNAGEDVNSENIDQALMDFVPAISASGKVVPIEWAVLSVPVSGVVVEISASENDAVNEGDILIRLSGSERMKASVTAAQLQFVSAEQAMQDLLDNADLSTALAKETFEDAQRDFNNTITVAPQVDIDQSFANMILAREKVNQAEDDFEPYSNKPEDNLERANYLSRLSQARDKYNNAVRQYNSFSTPGNETDIAIKQAKLELAQRHYEDVASGVNPEALELAQARIDNAKALLNSAIVSLEDLEIRAPFSGTVSQIQFRENEWVNPGQAALFLGNLTAFQVETTDLNEVDVTNLEIGIIAAITFDSLPGISITATVVSIASKSSPGGGVNYKVILQFDESPDGLRWDMTALVEFSLGD